MLKLPILWILAVTASHEPLLSGNVSSRHPTPEYLSYLIILAQAAENGDGTEECERDKRDKLAQCLQEATKEVHSCQKGCDSDEDDAASSNQCKRECSEKEAADRTACFDKDKEFECI